MVKSLDRVINFGQRLMTRPVKTKALPWGDVFSVLWICGTVFLGISVFSKSGVAAEPPPPGTPDPSGKPPETKADKPEDEDYSTTPFTEYGEFHESSDEDADTKFFQYGRFFGVSLGLGFQFIDGYRGSLWQGGFPMVDVKVHYWFDFNVALDLGFFTAAHYFDSTSTTFLGHYDVNIFHMGLDVKYYFNTTNLSAALSFANPYILLGAGAFSKTQTSSVQANLDTDTSIGLSAGFGLEFILTPRKTYFEIETKIHIVNFKDTSTTLFQSMSIPNLSGNFYTISGNLLFTW